jgi:retinol dehydrogenase 14
VDALAADMTSQAEVRRLAVAVLDAYSRLDVLVNNVGGFWAHRHQTADGLEHTFALNRLARFLLTNLLLDRLRASAPARVVTVSSQVQATGRIDFDDLQDARDYSDSAPTTSPSSRTLCSPSSWPAASKAPPSRPLACTPG